MQDDLKTEMDLRIAMLNGYIHIHNQDQSCDFAMRHYVLRYSHAISPRNAMFYYTIKAGPTVCRCQTHHFVCEGMAEVGAVGGEQQRQTVDQLRLGEAEDNWRRERESHADKASAWTPV